VLFDGKNLDAWAKKAGKDWLKEDGPAAWKLVDANEPVVQEVRFDLPYPDDINTPEDFERLVTT